MVVAVTVATATHAETLARFGHALSERTRSRILLALRDGPAYPADLADALGVSRTNLSNHLACLRGCGLVVTAQEGRRTRYELADPRLAHALGDLLGLVLAVDPLACPAAETEDCC
jgi:ArsR family transcriptional regulator, cadmium/lead-responsive transcriptional repressor